ncbi:MAG: hypothetical protein MK226_02130 [Saprospiraceae bacterium]|jgi:predicted flap endonuclease-1-like 5' DNA nuclease|nr:hypothetical protein [Saprospiraceae bacterium]
MFNDILLLALFGLPCWLLWGLGSLLAFLLGWWLNSLLSGYRKKMVEAEKARDAEHARYINLEKDQKSLLYKLEQSEAETKKVRGLLNKCEADRIGLLAKIERDKADDDPGMVASGSGPKAAIKGGSQKNDNLQIIEGIGPKIEGLLKNAGINNWSDLAAASVDKIKEILAAAGDRYRLAQPDTWPKQASLAAEGKFNELKDYQDALDGGKDPS